MKVDVLTTGSSPLPGTAGIPHRTRALSQLLSWMNGAASARRRFAFATSYGGKIVSTTQAGRPPSECVLWAGQTAGGITEILSVAELMRELVVEAEAALARAPELAKTVSHEQRNGPRRSSVLLPCVELPLEALSGRRWVADQCQLSGVKQTSQYDGAMSAFDPKRTWRHCNGNASAPVPELAS